MFYFHLIPVQLSALWPKRRLTPESKNLDLKHRRGNVRPQSWRRRDRHDNTTLLDKSRPFKLQTRSPHVSLFLNLAGRQGCNSQTEGWSNKALHSRAAALKKKKERKGGKKKKTGRQLGHGVHQASRKQLTAQGLGQSRRGTVCYWKR